MTGQLRNYSIWPIPRWEITTFHPCPRLHQPRALSRLPLHSKIAGSTGLCPPPHLWKTMEETPKTWRWNQHKAGCNWKGIHGMFKGLLWMLATATANQNCSAPLSAPVKITCFAPSLIACLSSSQGCSTTDFAKIEGCVGQKRQKPQIWAFVRINDPTQGYIHQEKLRIIMQKGPTILGHIGHKHRKIIANKERSYNIIQPSKTWMQPWITAKHWYSNHQDSGYP